MYFAGEAAMIIWSPFILDELAGLRDSAPPTINSDPTSKELASKTGIITTLAGPLIQKALPGQTLDTWNHRRCRY